MAKKNNTTPESEKKREGFRPIKHTGVGDQRSVFANHILIQHSEVGEFFLSFFEMPPPIVLGTADERTKQIEAITEVEARCVARVVLSKERVAGLISALAENYAKFSQLESIKSASRGEHKHEQAT